MLPRANKKRKPLYYKSIKKICPNEEPSNFLQKSLKAFLQNISIKDNNDLFYYNNIIREQFY